MTIITNTTENKVLTPEEKEKISELKIQEQWLGYAAVAEHAKSVHGPKESSDVEGVQAMMLKNAEEIQQLTMPK